jgi:hypothetical protein
MTEEQRLWDKLSKVLERFKVDAEPLVERLRALGRQKGAGEEREKKKLYMREWMKRKRDKDKAEKAQVE